MQPIDKKASPDLSVADRDLVIGSLPALNQSQVDFDQDYIFYWIAADTAYLSGRLIFAELEIYQVYVKPEVRRQGIGRSLLEAVQRDQEINRVILEVRASNLGARRLYDRAGFLQIGQRENYYDSPCEDAILMEWRRSK